MGSGNYLLAVLFDKKDRKKPGQMNYVCERYCLSERQARLVCRMSTTPKGQTPIFEDDDWFSGADCVRCGVHISRGGY